MKHRVWNIQYVSPPSVMQYCKKCGSKTEYRSSGQFRVNAQRKYLDIWLIYKCSHCDNTWNAEIYSRIHTKSIDKHLLECFHRNDEALAKKYAMRTELLQRNGVEVQPPSYQIEGEDFSINEAVTLVIHSDCHFPLKVSEVLRNKLKLSHSVLNSLLETGKIRCMSKQDLRKIKLHEDVTILWNHPNEAELANKALW